MDLMPCPFCGNSVHLEKAYSVFGLSVIYCNDCDMFFSLDDINASDDDICEAWNRRTADAEPVRHAHWIGKGGIFSCSHCGAEDGVMTSFCSSCGFRMDGDAE